MKKRDVADPLAYLREYFKKEAIHSERNLRRRIGYNGTYDPPPVTKKSFGGRPTKYRPEFCILAHRMLVDTSSVATLRSVAAALDISPDTFYTWRKRYPDFDIAIEWGKSIQECWFASMLATGMKNYQGTLILLVRLHGWVGSASGRKDKPPKVWEAVQRQQRAAPLQRVDWSKPYVDQSFTDMPAKQQPS